MNVNVNQQNQRFAQRDILKPHDQNDKKKTKQKQSDEFGMQKKRVFHFISFCLLLFSPLLLLTLAHFHSHLHPNTAYSCYGRPKSSDSN